MIYVMVILQGLGTTSMRLTEVRRVRKRTTRRSM